MSNQRMFCKHISDEDINQLKIKISSFYQDTPEIKVLSTNLVLTPLHVYQMFIHYTY